jgi:hypothetical protein
MVPCFVIPYRFSSQVLAALRNIFPDASYPDEANAEPDDISAADLQRRQRTQPPAKVLQVK